MKQNGKVRPIDDSSEHGINATFGSGQKVSMKGLDHVVAVSDARLEALAGGRFFALEDDEGECWQGELHPEWTKENWVDLVGRVAELRSAYKQLAIHPAHASLSAFGPAVQSATS